MKIIKLWFSSPSGAFYFSIKHEDEQRRIFEVFVPFRGFLFFYWMSNFKKEVEKYVFVPFRGFLFFYGDYWNCGGKVTRFRPLPGLFIFLSCPLHPAVSAGCSLRLRRKTANQDF